MWDANDGKPGKGAGTLHHERLSIGERGEGRSGIHFGK